jgi:microcystin-dependent protein
MSFLPLSFKYYIMKKLIPIVILLCAQAFNLHAQNVGIRVLNPTEVLHVDSGHVKIGNSVWVDSSTNSLLKFGDANYMLIGEDEDDDIMTLRAMHFNFRPSSSGYSGNVGIGLAANTQPTSNLQVEGTMNYKDGNQGNGKVLTTDNNGNATWQPPAQTTPTLGLKYCIAIAGVYPSFVGGGPSSLETYLGEIKIFPYTQVPDGFLECKGQLLSIAQNTALFSLLGTTYGGNGLTNFALPNLTNTAVIGQ